MTDTVPADVPVRARRATQPAPGFDVRSVISGPAGVLAGTANVIMQLSWPQVGYGVKESKVDDGNVTKHPVKRARTTFTFLAVALLGDAEDQRLFRRAVNRQHAQVRSTAESPVAYNAMDPELQLWVAACLYYGTVDLYERMHGPMDDATADALYAHCERFGTSLQVRPGMWPADRAAFADYWEQGLQKVSIDDTIRRHLLALIEHEYAARPVQLLMNRRTRFVTTGFLPPPFREAMQLPWTELDQRRFDRFMRRLGAVDRRLPEALRLFPYNVLLRDVRRRVRTGRPLV